MNYLKKLLKGFSITLIALIISLFLITIISYISEGFIFKAFKIILPLLSIFLGSIFMGKNSKEKGWLEGIKFGLIFTIIFLILYFVFTNNPFGFKQIIYYIIIIFISSLGGMLGISKEIEKK